MEPWPEACFKAYDIRGRASGDGTGELTPDSPTDCVAPWRPTSNANPMPSDETFEIPRQPCLATDGRVGRRWCRVLDGHRFHRVRLPRLLDPTGERQASGPASHLPMPTHNGFKMQRYAAAGWREIQELKSVFLKGEFIEKRAIVDHLTWMRTLTPSLSRRGRWRAPSRSPWTAATPYQGPTWLNC